MTYDLGKVMAVYMGSNGDETKQLYEALAKLGVQGDVGVNLFRACKASERAKGYRRHRGDAYAKKQWSMDNLARTLGEHAQALGILWGWGEDAKQEFHRWVLYVDIPTGQVSFHTAERGTGPDYAGKWDGLPGQGPGRICTWIVRLFVAQAVPA